MAAQRSEVAAVILAFQTFQQTPMSVVSDSQYVTNLVHQLPGAYLALSIDANLMALFLTLQALLSACCHPYFVTHIRSHTPLPGPLSEGNARADEATKCTAASLFSDPFQSHHFFHQNAKALAKQCHIPLSQAQQIVRTCPQCTASFPSMEGGVNPRGLSSNALWQMDVTQVPLFGLWKYVHVSIDTHSGVMCATPQKGEKAPQVINHLYSAIAALGKPQRLKMDNVAAY